MNERLRASMATAHIDVEGLAREVEVDPKTVQRWLGAGAARPASLGGRRAGRRGRALPLAARARGERGAAPHAGLVAAYANRADVEPRQWWDLLENARHHIDLLGYAMLFPGGAASPAASAA